MIHQLLRLQTTADVPKSSTGAAFRRFAGPTQVICEKLKSVSPSRFVICGRRIDSHVGSPTAKLETFLKARPNFSVDLVIARILL